MGKLTKNQKLALAKIEAGKAYSLGEASQLVKDITYTKFDHTGFRHNEYYVDGIRIKYENIFETDVYYGITTTTWNNIKDDRGRYFDRSIPITNTIRINK